MNRATSATGWVRNPDGTLGWTWNPLTGCLNHTPEGLCLGGLFPCYAWKLAHGRLRSRYLANDVIAPVYAEGGELYTKANKMLAIDPFYPRLWEERLFDPINWSRYGGSTIGYPKGIFVCDMGELFGDWIPREWQDKIFDVIHRCPHHRFYLLTKQPRNLAKFNPFPDNCYVGVTATNFDTMDEALIGLYDVEAKVKFLSIEPFLGEIPVPSYGFEVDGIIIGAQTKPTFYPKLEWVEEIVRAADKDGVPVFLKDNLKPFLDRVPTRVVYQYGSGKLRQELPK